jgi:hypothetical protein
MQYLVTTGGSDDGKGPAPAAIHQPAFSTAAAALEYARDLAQKGEKYIQISDGSGHTVEGSELEACLNGRKQIADYFPSQPN